MSEVTVYLASDLHPSEHVVLQPDYESVVFDLAALREELAAAKRSLITIAELDNISLGEYQQRLTAAEQRNAELTQLLEATRDARDAEQYASNELRETLSGMNALMVDLVNSPHRVVVPLELWKRINNFVDAASQPTESGASDARRKSSLEEKKRILSEPHCPECGHPDCNGQCHGDGMMGASE